MKPNLIPVLIICALIAIVAGHSAGAEKKDREGKHQVVFELTSDTPELWNSVLNNVENLQKALGAEHTRIEVVAHGKGLGFVLKKNEALRARMEKLAGVGVAFAACENTMRREHVQREELLPFAISVDSGVAEVVRKQEDGWAYLRSGG